MIGPAQNDVTSITRRPASGSGTVAGGVVGDVGDVGVAARAGVAATRARWRSVSRPTPGAAVSGRAVAPPPRRYGTAGWTKPCGLSVMHPPSTSGANPGTVSPLPTSATGI